MPIPIWNTGLQTGKAHLLNKRTASSRGCFFLPLCENFRGCNTMSGLIFIFIRTNPIHET